MFTPNRIRPNHGATRTSSSEIRYPTVNTAPTPAMNSGSVVSMFYDVNVSMTHMTAAITVALTPVRTVAVLRLFIGFLCC